MKKELPQIYEIEEITDFDFADSQQNSNKIGISNILDQSQPTGKILSIKLQIDDICSDELKSLSEKCRNKQTNNDIIFNNSKIEARLKNKFVSFETDYKFILKQKLKLLTAFDRNLKFTVNLK